MRELAIGLGLVAAAVAALWVSWWLAGLVAAIDSPWADPLGMVVMLPGFAFACLFGGVAAMFVIGGVLKTFWQVGQRLRPLAASLLRRGR